MDGLWRILTITGDGVAVDTIDEIEPIEEAKEEVTEEVEKPEAELEDSEDNDEEEAEEEQEEEQEEEEVEEKEETEEEVSEPTVVSEILSSLGYEGEYADTAEGLTEMTKDVASQMADDRIDEVLEKFPLVKKHLDYVLAGGESQKFMTAYDPNLDYNTMEIAEDDSRSQKAILSDYFQQKGHDADFIKEILSNKLTYI